MSTVAATRCNGDPSGQHELYRGLSRHAPSAGSAAVVPSACESWTSTTRGLSMARRLPSAFSDMRSRENGGRARGGRARPRNCELDSRVPRATAMAELSPSTAAEAVEQAEFARAGSVAPSSLIVGPPRHDKLAGWDLYRAIGSPKLIVAPMVDQSELVRRMVTGAPLSLAGLARALPTARRRARVLADDPRGSVRRGRASDLPARPVRSHQRRGRPAGPGPTPLRAVLRQRPGDVPARGDEDCGARPLRRDRSQCVGLLLDRG